MMYGYECSEKEKKELKFNSYHPSTQKINFDKECGNIFISLLLVQKIDEIIFGNNDIELYKSFLTLSIDKNLPKDLSIEQIKGAIKDILMEQAIVAGVTNWEDYFSEISKYILIDKVLRKKIYSDKGKFKNFLNDFNLKNDFFNEMFLNGPQLNYLRFADYIRRNKKIDFQNKDSLKKFFRIIYDIDIVKIDEKNWSDIAGFIEDRHIIVHTKKYIIDKYPREKIEKIIKNMKKLVENIDENLFTVYE